MFPSSERFFRRIGRGWLWVLSYCLEKEKSMDGFFFCRLGNRKFITGISTNFDHPLWLYLQKGEIVMVSFNRDFLPSPAPVVLC